LQSVYCLGLECPLVSPRAREETLKVWVLSGVLVVTVKGTVSIVIVNGLPGNELTEIAVTCRVIAGEFANETIN
jgi:hypothetical protein